MNPADDVTHLRQVGGEKLVEKSPQLFLLILLSVVLGRVPLFAFKHEFGAGTNVR